MAAKTFVSGEVLTAADTNTYLANSGLVLIGQRSVASGIIVYSDCFNSTYTNYKIVIDNLSAAGACNADLYLYSGSAYSVDGFYANGIKVNGTTVTGISLGGNSASMGINITPATTNGGNGTIEVQQPFLSRNTSFQFAGTDARYNGDECKVGTGIHYENKSWAGFKITGAGTTLNSGTVSVYGYRVS